VLQAVRIFETKVVSRIKSDMTFHCIKRIALFKSAVPKLLNAGPNSRSYQRPRAGLLCVLKKKQKSNTPLSLRFVYRYCYLFYLFRNMFEM